MTSGNAFNVPHEAKCPDGLLLPNAAPAAQWQVVTSHRSRLRDGIPCGSIVRSSMIQSFADPGTLDIFNGEASRRARVACPINLWAVARRKLDQLSVAHSLRRSQSTTRRSTRSPKGRSEGPVQYPNQRAISRLLRWTAEGPTDVEIVDYHR